jgi:tellurite methyltransferase
MFTKSKKFYWNSFYNSTTTVQEPSDFATFVLKEIKKTYGLLLDIGCGNGRDTFFFLKNDIKAVGCDQSSSIIKKNNKLKKVFSQVDFCKKGVNLKKNINFFYARFFLHSISLKEEEVFFNNIKKNTFFSCQIYLEFRTDKDPLMLRGKYLSKHERFTDHYRRFINVDSFKKRVKKKNFKILFLKTSNKFAIFKNDKPDICRVILSYKKII